MCRPNHPRQCPDVDAFTGCVSLRRTARRHAAGRTLSPPLPVHRPGRRTHRDRSVCGGAPPHRSLTASPSYMCQPLEELPTQRPSQDSSFPLRLTPHRPLAPHRLEDSPAPIRSHTQRETERGRERDRHSGGLLRSGPANVAPASALEKRPRTHARGARAHERQRHIHVYFPDSRVHSTGLLPISRLRTNMMLLTNTITCTY